MLCYVMVEYLINREKLGEECENDVSYRWKVREIEESLKKLYCLYLDKYDKLSF